MNRREFLELLASAGIGFGLSQTPLKRLVQTNPVSTRWPNGYSEMFKTAACGLCPAGCSLRVRLVNGYPVGVSGNPLDPFTGGGLCAKGYSILHQLYHPNRITKPMKRVDNNGERSWQPVEWEDALNEVVVALQKNVGDNPERLLFLNGRPYGFMNQLVERWMQHMGSPNHIPDHYLHAFPIASRYMMGKTFFPAFDLSKLELLVSIGDPFLDYSMNPASQTHWYAEFRQREQKGRGRLIVFDDSNGITGEKADRFYKVKPGTHGAIMLALANVLVRFERYDRDFIENHTSGLQEWTQDALHDFAPETVENITGVPADVLYELASELARSDHKAVMAGPVVMSGTGGLQNAMSVLALNALLGSIDRDLRMETSIEHLFEDELLLKKPQDAVRRIDQRNFPISLNAPWTIPDEIQSNPDLVTAVFLYYSNPVASHPAGSRWVKALKTVPLIVSFSPFLDETSSLAHWILPDSLCLERHQEFVHPPITGMSRISLTQPMQERPLYDTRPTGDVLLELVRRNRSDAQKDFPWKRYEDYLNYCLGLVAGLQTGTIFSERQKFDSFIELARRGYRVESVTDEDLFVRTAFEKGGWVQPLYLEGQWGRLFSTPSGKFEFVSSELRNDVVTYLADRRMTLKDLDLQEAGKTFYMPSYLPRSWKGTVGKLTWLITFNTGSETELPWWWEVVGMHRYLQWQMWAEQGTNEAEAARLDATHRPWCQFELKGKSFRLPLVLRSMGHERVLVIPVGFRPTVDRSTPLPRGFNILEWIDYDPDPLTGLPSFYFDLQSVETTEA